MDTAAGNSADAKEKKPVKNANTGKQAAAASNSKDAKDTKSPKEKKEKKKKKRRWLKFALIFLFIALIGGFLFVSWHFNLFAVRDQFFAAIYTYDPNYKEVTQLRREIESSEKKLIEREVDLDKREEGLEARSEELDLREADLARQKTQMEEEAAARVPIYRKPLSETELADMTALSKTFAAMEPEEAASILSSLYSIEDMTAILYYMSSKGSAAILAVMDTYLAASITDMLLHFY